MPLVKWLLAIPHYIVLFFLYIAAFFVVIIAWFAILFTGRYPKSLFDFVVGVVRWRNRVARLRVPAGHRQVPALLARVVGIGCAGNRECGASERRARPGSGPALGGAFQRARPAR